ncbi:MAG: hypothetical protein Q8Q12_15045 [bacterium]|nr:hypothetical protein [bacterium]
MKDFRNIPTNALWSAIEENARLAQKHVYWLEYLDNVRVLCALIDERIEVFERRMRLERAMKEHRTGWSWEKVGWTDDQPRKEEAMAREVVVLRGGGDSV